MRVKIILILSSILLLISLFNGNNSVAATVTPDWMSGEPVHQTLDTNLTQTKCVYQKRDIAPILYRVYDTNDPNVPKEVCVFQGDGYEYAYYYRNYFFYPYWPSFGTTGESGIAISTDGGEMRPVANLDPMNSSSHTYLGKTTSFLRQVRNANWGSEFWFYKDFTKHLVLNEDGQLYINGDPDYIYKDVAGNHLSAEGVGVSDNGKWISFATPNVGVVVFNPETLEARRVSDRYVKNGNIWPNPVITTSVSNGGDYVIAGGWNVPTEVIDIDALCGSKNDMPANVGGNGLGRNNCKFRDLTYLTWNNSQAYGSAGYRAFDDVRMSSDGGHFEYNDRFTWHAIYAGNMRPLSQMKFLALGDSYASGEGDLSLDGKDYYQSGTNVYGNYRVGIPREMCHISTRSYPFLLASTMNLIPGSDMRSLACSGAISSDISSYDGTNIATIIDQNYRGQATQGMGWGSTIPRLEGAPNAGGLQDQARSDFTPGRVQQVEFVQKTKPEVATIMIGGNDMKFGDVMSQCVMSVRIGLGVSCKYAGQDGRQELAQIIHDDYPNLVKTYSAIRAAGSRYTKIYALGYPRLVSAKNASCLSTLDQSERASIVEAINYANAVIKQAAAAAGVNYIDISGALSGNELCSGGFMKYQYITYLSQLTYSKLASEVMKGQQAKDIFDRKGYFERGMQTDINFLEQYMKQRGEEGYREFAYSPWTAVQGVAQQMIHPNAAGHQAMARAIIKNFGEAGLNVCVDGENVTCAGDPKPGLSAPAPDAYMTGISIKSNTTYVSGDGPVSIEHRIDGALANTGDVVKKGADFVVRLAPKPEWSLPAAAPTVSLHSSPQYLGSMTTDGAVYSLQASIPSGTPVGMHTLYISVPQADGNDLVVTKDIFIEGPVGDIDDDGIPDATDTCAFDKPSGIDSDKDGIDDKCDMYVAISNSGSLDSIIKYDAPAAVQLRMGGGQGVVAFTSSPLYHGDTNVDTLPIISSNSARQETSRPKDGSSGWILAVVGATLVIGAIIFYSLRASKE